MRERETVAFFISDYPLFSSTSICSGLSWGGVEVDHVYMVIFTAVFLCIFLQVRLSNLAREVKSYTEQENIWFGPRQVTLYSTLVGLASRISTNCEVV